MTVSESDILSALRILQNAPDGILYAHRDLALQVLDQLKSVLNSTGEEPERHTSELADGIDTDHALLCGTTFNHPTLRGDEVSASGRRSTRSPCNDLVPLSVSSDVLSSSGSTASDQASTKKRKRGDSQIDRPAKLLAAVKLRLPELEEFSKKELTSHHWLLYGQGDVRLEYIKRIDGNKTPSNQDRLLKGLCQISLAQQFTSWERGRGWDSRVNQLCEQIHTVTACENAGKWKNRKRSGRISQYIREKGYPNSEHSVANKAICRGTNQLAFLCLVEEAFKGFSRAELDGTFAALTIFQYAEFQALKIHELPKILDLLREERYCDAANDNSQSESLLRRLRNVTVWSKGMQSDFETIVKGNIPHIGANPEPCLRPLLQGLATTHHQHPADYIPAPQVQRGLCQALDDLSSVESRSHDNTGSLDNLRVVEMADNAMLVTTDGEQISIPETRSTRAGGVISRSTQSTDTSDMQSGKDSIHSNSQPSQYLPVSNQVDLSKTTQNLSRMGESRFDALVSAACSSDTAGQQFQGRAPGISAGSFVPMPVPARETVLDVTELDFVVPFLDVNDIEFIDSQLSMFAPS